MNITKQIKIIDLALYLPKYKTLIIADSHIGYEEALNKQGVLIPRFQFKELIQRLEKIFEKVSPETIIINGDVKHEFGTISDQEWRHALKLIDFLSRHCKNLILIKGNHDKILGPIAKKRKITTADNIILDDILITHGHKLIEIPKQIKTIIIGHEHPAVSFKERPSEKFKCFLKGNFRVKTRKVYKTRRVLEKYKRKTLIVQPSFNMVTQGSDITREKLLSPFLTNLKNFECYIIEDKVYSPIKLKNI